jgi:hypothetical protein
MNLLTIAETAIKLRTTPKQIRHWIKTDKSFPCMIYSVRATRVLADNLEKWLLKKTERTTTPANT